MSEIRIKHLASHARAGETMTLRMLASHPNIHVPLQIAQAEDPLDKEFVAAVSQFELQGISFDHPYAKARELARDAVILVKQGTWAPTCFEGLVLIRHPYSFVASMLDYNHREGLSAGSDSRAIYARTYERLLRWAKAMDEEVFGAIGRSAEVIDALCFFYCYRVHWLLDQEKPVFRYELLVTEPRRTADGMCVALGLDFHDRMMESHKHHNGELGHGMNDLQRSIDRNSLDKWRALSLQTRRKVLRRCMEWLAEQDIVSLRGTPVCCDNRWALRSNSMRTLLDTNNDVFAVRVYRISHFLYKRRLILISKLVQRLNLILSGIDIHPAADLGDFQLRHSVGTVVGANVENRGLLVLYSNVTIGVRLPGTGTQPRFEGRVIIGTGSRVLGGIVLKDVTVGANSVVITSPPPNSTVVGAPARPVSKKM